MVRSTCKVIVRLKPKADELDDAVQCIENPEVSCSVSGDAVRLIAEKLLLMGAESHLAHQERPRRGWTVPGQHC